MPTRRLPLESDGQRQVSSFVKADLRKTPTQDFKTNKFGAQLSQALGDDSHKNEPAQPHVH